MRARREDSIGRVYDGGTVKAAVLHQPGQPLRIEDLELAPPREGEVLVQIKAAGVCHSDYHYMRGDLAHPLPAVLGHEGAGVVEQVGPGVTSVGPGDPVVLLWRTSCGRCEYCQTGRPALCPAGQGMRASGKLADGTTRLSLAGSPVLHFLGISCFAAMAVCRQESVLRIPEDIPWAVAALAGCSVMTGVGAVVNTARVQPGTSVLVIGCGGVGLSVVMGAILAGAARVIVADVNAAKLEMARGLGATDAIDASKDDVVGMARELTGGGVDFAFEVIGLPDTVTNAVRALRAGGTAVAVGVSPTGARAEVNTLDLVMQEKTLKGSIYGSTRPAADFARLFALYRAGRLPLDRLLSREFSLEKVNEAYDAMLGGTVARSVLIP